MALKHGAVRGGVEALEYSIWKAMKARCLRPTVRSYTHYGGRGIKVCERWMNDYAAFRDDMGPRPEGTSLDRIDNDGNYEPSNCRWATAREQLQNTRRNRMVTFNGQTLCMAEWARRLGIAPHTLHKRLSRWPLERAMMPGLRPPGGW